MLDLALKARMPLINVTTRDRVHLGKVLKFLCPEREVKQFGEGNSAEIAEDVIYWRVASKQTSGESLAAGYEHFAKKNSTLVYANLPDPPPEYFNAGEVPIPKELVFRELVRIFAEPEESIEDAVKRCGELVSVLMTALGGLTIREVKELFRLQMATGDKITNSALTAMRHRLYQPLDGLMAVNPKMEVYQPLPDWDKFVAHERQFFLTVPDPRLRSRGALLDGPPGTGKTQGSKYLATQWGVPLYRMDATVNSKWYGESERNLRRLLDQVSHEAPAILLFDEAEKMFMGQDGGTSVSRRIMSLLLWWLQENEAPVFVIMTTNDSKVLPPELLRPGRIDKRFVFNGIGLDATLELTRTVVATFTKLLPEGEKSVEQIMKAVGADLKAKYQDTYIQADTVQMAHSYVKRLIAGETLTMPEKAGLKIIK